MTTKVSPEQVRAWIQSYDLGALQASITRGEIEVNGRCNDTGSTALMEAVKARDGMVLFVLFVWV